MSAPTWGDGIWQPDFGTKPNQATLESNGIQARAEVFMAEAVGPEVSWQGRRFFQEATDPTPTGPFYPSTTPLPGDPPGTQYFWNFQTHDPEHQTIDGLQLFTILVGVRHNGSTITNLGAPENLGHTDIAPDPVPVTRPYWMAGGRDKSRWISFGPNTNEVTLWPSALTVDIDPARLWLALFDGRPSLDHTPTVQGLPAAGATTVTLTGLPPGPPDARPPTDSGRFCIESSLPYQGRVVRLGGDRVRYRVTYRDFGSYIAGLATESFNISPSLQPSTAAAIAGGNTSVEWLPQAEIPVDTPFDVLLEVEEAYRTRDMDPGYANAGIIFTPYGYYHYHEPRSWYP